MSQTVGKVVFGRIADHPRVNRVYLYQMCLLVCSVLTTLLPLFTTFNALLAYCIVFGFHEGCFVVLIAVLTGDIAGRKMMATAYGVMYFFTGIPMMLGPPVAGKWKDKKTLKTRMDVIWIHFVNFEDAKTPKTANSFVLLNTLLAWVLQKRWLRLYGYSYRLHHGKVFGR